MIVFNGFESVRIYSVNGKAYPSDSFLMIRRGSTEDKVILDFPHMQVEVSKDEILNACNKIWKET